MSSPVKHEYIQGQIYAMAGASDAHVRICTNLAAMLRNHVRSSGCRLYLSDMKARIESLNIYYYPDVMVTCDPKDLILPIVYEDILFTKTINSSDVTKDKVLPEYDIKSD